MRCIDCRYNNGCSGSSCYYEEKEKEMMRKLEADPEANEKKYYTLFCGYQVDFNDVKMSKIEVHNHRRDYPDDDMREFFTKEQIEEYHHSTSEYIARNGLTYIIENPVDGMWCVRPGSKIDRVYIGSSFEDCFNWIEARYW